MFTFEGNIAQLQDDIYPYVIEIRHKRKSCTMDEERRNSHKKNMKTEKTYFLKEIIKNLEKNI